HENELCEIQSCDCAANGVKTGHGDGVGGVVDDQVHAGHGFERADIAPLATDDATLHLFVGDRYDGRGDLADRVARIALDSDREDLARLRFGLRPGIHLD